MSRTPRIALVTYRPRPGGVTDPDLPALLDALTAAGATGQAVAWDDPEADWASFDLAVVRSTWDYTERVDEFLAWADRCAALTRLVNPAPVLRWNSDKRYLDDLARADVPVVPTRFVPPGAEPAFPDGPFVVKPTWGAGARYAARYEDSGAVAVRRAREQVSRMHAEGLTAMVQPYMRAIETTGERALVHIGGTFRHAIRKGAVLEAGAAFDAAKTAHPGVRGWTPGPAELAVARRALAAVPLAGAPAYARVDLVDGDDGAPRVMELELIEPNLFLAPHPETASAFAHSLKAHIT